MRVSPDVAEHTITCQQHGDATNAAFLHVDVFPVVPLPAWEETGGGGGYRRGNRRRTDRNRHLFNKRGVFEPVGGCVWVGPRADAGVRCVCGLHLSVPFSLDLLGGWESSTPATWAGPSASLGPDFAVPEPLRHIKNGRTDRRQVGSGGPGGVLEVCSFLLNH